MKVTEVFWKNLKAWKDGYRIIANKGSARSSKTVSIVQLMDFIAANSKKHRKISIASQSLPHLREGVIYEYDKYLMREGMTRAKRESLNQFLLNNSIIEYFSLDGPTGLNRAIGPGRDILWVNEPNRGVSFEIFNQLRNRTSETIFLDWNPSGPFWLQNEGILNDPRTIQIHSTWLDNIENLSKAQIQDFIDAKKKSKLSDYWNYWWKVYGEGKDGVLSEERIMPMIRKVKKVPDDAIEIPSGLDFGWFPHPSCFVRLWIRKKEITGGLVDELYVQQIVYDQKLSINSNGEGAKNLCEILLSRGIAKNHLIIAESADPRCVNDMKDAGFTIEAVKKKAVETSIRTFHDYKIFFVDSPYAKDEEAHNEFDNYRFARDKRTNEILGIPADKQADHSIDATRYVLISKDKRWSV